MARPDDPPDLREYRDLLRMADQWGRECRTAFPDRVPCGRGCRDCCLGLFDISLADRDLLREGMEGLDAAAARDIRRRAEAILRDLRASFPRLGGDLDGWRPEKIDGLCDAAGPVECPVLGPEGECRLYGHRPLVCRLTGVPVVDVTGEIVHAAGCEKCALGPEEVPRLDARTLRRQERRFLRRRYPGRSGVTLFVPQAVAGGAGEKA